MILDPREQRRDVRYPKNAAAVLERATGEKITAQTVNISAGGVLLDLEHDAQVEVGELLSCAIRLYDRRPLQAWGLGRVVRKRGRSVAIGLEDRIAPKGSALKAPCNPGVTPSPPRVLMVDDDRLGRELARRVLVAEGFEVEGADTADSAERMLRERDFDLVVLDVVMRDRSGFELCASLQADRDRRDIPVIFLSALDEPERRIQGLRAGAVDFIAKPFYAEELVARARVHLRLRQARLIVASQQQARLAELRAAQQSILVQPADLPDAGFAVCSRPLAEVGGDVYDVFQLGPDMFAYFVADVSGHGVGASVPTCAVKAVLRQYSAALYSADETLRGINSVIGSILRDGQHLTACYARYSRMSKRLRFVSAGHPAPIHVSASGRATVFPTESDPLGIFPSVILDERSIAFEPGDRLYLYTDGLIEDYAAGGGRASGLERLRAACERRHALPLENVAEAITDDLRPSSAPADDDLLLMAVEARA